MSVNSTSNYLLDNTCYTVSSYINIVFNALRATLLLTLSTPVLYLGYQRWRQQHSFKTARHSDILTYNVATMELIWVLGFIYYYCGTYTNHSLITTVGTIAYLTGYYGEICFHVLTCIERYLAVVHPITYLGRKNAHGVKLRNISIGCAWLLCFGLACVRVAFAPNQSTILLLCFLVFSIIILSFCSLAVLCVLIRPGPGEGYVEKERVDQSKVRAFHTITAITCTVWLWFAGVLVTTALNVSHLLIIQCLLPVCIIWFNLPSCLVLPLLYLHRAGKLSCCCCSN